MLQLNNLQPARIEMTNAYNNFPGIKTVLNDLQEENIYEYLSFVNAPDMPFWHNDADKMVFAIKGGLGLNEQARALSSLHYLAKKWQADEFHFKKIDGKLVARMWWD